MRILLVFVLLLGFLKASPAKADFGLTASDENETDEEEFFKQDLSRTSTEDLKLGIGKRWAK
jgi:hypothetical protein